MNLERFNTLPPTEAEASIAHCVAIGHWAQALVAGRPYTSVKDALAAGDRLARSWTVADLQQALTAHPRIGERASGSDKEATQSRREQSAMSEADTPLRQAMLAGNRDYEARFGHLFLIRAKGRSGEEMLAALQRRLKQDRQTEQQEVLEQLREITLLRLEESLT